MPTTAPSVSSSPRRSRSTRWLSLAVLTLSCASACSSSSPGTCFWKEGSTTKHFTFTLTTPDGVSQVPNRSYTPDAGWSIQDFEGVVTEKSGNEFAVDSCLTPPSCQASVYRFAVCESHECSAAASPAAIEPPIATGRRVRVVWRMDNYAVAYSLGLYWLAVYDADAGASHGHLLFLGSGGRDPGAENRNVALPFDDLPFSVKVVPLSCGQSPNRAEWRIPDDYAFVFSPKQGSGSTLKLGTDETGSFNFAWPNGDTQRLRVHVLEAVQTDYSDDYWNWDFWAVPETGQK